MLISSLVKYLYPERRLRISWIIGSGYCRRLITLLSSRRSPIQRALPSFLGVMKHGWAHSLVPCFSKTPRLTISSSVRLNTPSCTRGTGYGLECLGSAPSITSMCIFLCGYLPNVPSNSLACRLRTAARSACCSFVRCCCFSTTVFVSTRSYRGSKIGWAKKLSKQSSPRASAKKSSSSSKPYWSSTRSVSFCWSHVGSRIGISLPNHSTFPVEKRRSIPVLRRKSCPRIMSYRQSELKTKQSCLSTILFLSNSGRCIPFILTAPFTVCVPARVDISAGSSSLTGLAPLGSVLWWIIVLLLPESNRTRSSLLLSFSFIVLHNIIVVGHKSSWRGALHFAVGTLKVNCWCSSCWNMSNVSGSSKDSSMSYTVSSSASTYGCMSRLCTKLVFSSSKFLSISLRLKLHWLGSNS